MLRSLARRLGPLALVAIGAIGATLATPAVAAPYAPPSTDAQAVALHKLGAAKQSSYSAPKLKFKVGHAEIFVNAPMGKVRSTVTDYASYSALMPRFEKSKLLKKTSAAAEVFLYVPILHGAASMWVVESFAAPVPEGQGEKVVGVMLKGNVDDMRATWRYRPVDDQHTIVSLDLYIEPRITVPDAVLVQHLEGACADGVGGVKDGAQGLLKVASSKP